MAKSELHSWRSNLETVKELLLDEQKVITYVSVAKDFCVHVNEAKILLTEVLKDVRRKQPAMHLNVNHIISGLSGNNSAKTIICSEPELDTHKNSFNTVFYHHIYSIGLGKEAVDSAALVSLNQFKDFTLCPGLIKSTVCSKRTSEDIETLKLKCQVQNTVIETKLPIQKLPLKKEKTVEKIANVDDKIVKIKTEVISPKKETSNGSINKTNGSKNKGIAGIFTKSNSTPFTKSNKTEDSQKQTSKTENKGLSSFLTKSNSAPITKPNQTVQYKTEKSNKTDMAVEDQKMEINVETIEDTSKKPIKTEPETSKKKSKSLSQIKKNGKIDKKRKRVLQVSDSDSDNDPFSDGKPEDPVSEDEIPPTPATNTVKITSGILNPKKRRKIVDKTYTDEDGYILTRKEEIYESCSEDEVVPETTVETVKVEKENVQEANKVKTEVKKPNKASKRKISPPQKGKQATMMNFFNKI